MTVEQEQYHRHGTKEAQAQRLVQRRFEGASLEQMDAAIETIVAGVCRDHPQAGAVELYRAIASELPAQLSAAVHQEVVQALNSKDEVRRRCGAKVLICLYTKSILSAVDPYLGDDPSENDEMVQAAMVGVYQRIGRVRNYKQPSTGFGVLAGLSIARYIAARDNLAIDWVTDGKHTVIIEAVERVLQTHPADLEEAKIRQLAETIAEETGVRAHGVQDYLRYRLFLVSPESVDPEEERLQRFMMVKIRPRLRLAIGALSDRQRQVIKLRYGLDGKARRSLEETGVALGLPTERVRILEGVALRRLKNPVKNHGLSLAVQEYPPGRNRQEDRRSEQSRKSLKEDDPVDYLDIPDRLFWKLQSCAIGTIGVLMQTFPSHLQHALSPDDIILLRKAIFSLVRQSKGQDVEKRLIERMIRF